MRSSITRSLLLALAVCATGSATRPAHAVEAPAAFESSQSARDAEAWQRFAIDAAKSSDLRVRIATSAPGFEERDGRF